MSHTITPTDAGNITSVTVPSDGDPETSASVETPFQAIANLAAYCRALLFGSRDGNALIAMHNGTWLTPSFTSPTLTGTITVQAPILGDGTNLILGQAGPEQLHIINALTTINAVTVGGVAIFNNTVELTNGHSFLFDVGSTASLSGVISLATVGHINWREVTLPTDADHTFLVTDGDWVRTPGILAAPRVWTIDSTSALRGSKFRVVITPAVGSAQLTIQWRNSVPAVTGSIVITPTSTNLGAFIELGHDGTTWHCIGSGSGLAGTGS